MEIDARSEGAERGMYARDRNGMVEWYRFGKGINKERRKRGKGERCDRYREKNENEGIDDQILKGGIKKR